MIFNTKVPNTRCECTFSRNRHQYWFWDTGFMDESCAVNVSSRRPQMQVNNPCSLLGAPNPVEPLFFRAPAILARSLPLSLSLSRSVLVHQSRKPVPGAQCRFVITTRSKMKPCCISPDAVSCNVVELMLLILYL